MTSQGDCIELGKMAVPGMRIKVRWFPGGLTRQERWRAPSNILTFSVVLGEPVLLRNLSDGCREFRPAAPLMFRPRSAVWESRINGSRMLTVSSYFDGEFASASNASHSGAISIDDFSMIEMMQVLCDEVRSPGDASADLIGAIGTMLRIKLHRLARQALSGPSLAEQSCGADIALIREHVRSRKGSTPTASELAGLCNMSRRSLLRRVRKATGKSTSRYVAETQLNKAKTLLVTSNMTLQQIAYEAGYASPASFSSKFKSLTGMTPSAFRNRVRPYESLIPSGSVAICGRH